MTTCCIEPYFRRHFPGHVVSIATGLCDVIPAVTRFNPSSLAGVELDEQWGFGVRVNTVAGPSGSGKTRVLEALKPLSSTAQNLPPPEPADFMGKSMGQTLLILTELMLNIQPPETCLMMDDVFCCFDKANMECACGLLRVHQKQVVVTVPSHAERLVEMLSELPSARVFRLPLAYPRNQGVQDSDEL